MQIRIPKPIVKAYYKFEDWGDQSVGRFRRIDVLLAAVFLAGAGYSYGSGGWLVLLQFTVLFIFISLCCIWMGR